MRSNSPGYARGMNKSPNGPIDYSRPPTSQEIKQASHDLQLLRNRMARKTTGGSEISTQGSKSSGASQVSGGAANPKSNSISRQLLEEDPFNTAQSKKRAPFKDDEEYLPAPPSSNAMGKARMNTPTGKTGYDKNLTIPSTTASKNAIVKPNNLPKSNTQGAPGPRETMEQTKKAQRPEYGRDNYSDEETEPIPAYGAKTQTKGTSNSGSNGTRNITSGSGVQSVNSPNRGSGLGAQQMMNNRAIGPNQKRQEPQASTNSKASSISQKKPQVSRKEESSEEEENEREIDGEDRGIKPMKSNVYKLGKFNADSLPPGVENEEEDEEDAELYPCPEGCGRNFNARAMEKHQKICKKVFQQKRKAFKSNEQRIISNEQVSIMKKDPKKPQPKAQSSAPGKIPKWKMQSAGLRSAILAGKGQKLTAEQERMIALNDQAQEDSMTRCPYCGRTFNENAAKKHIPVCERNAEKNRMKQGPPKATSTLNTQNNAKKATPTNQKPATMTQPVKALSKTPVKPSSSSANKKRY